MFEFLTASIYTEAVLRLIFFVVALFNVLENVAFDRKKFVRYWIVRGDESSQSGMNEIRLI